MPPRSDTFLSPALKEGDEIRLVAPAGVFDRDRFADGVEILRARGFEPTWRPDVLDRHRYLAGGDERRLAELQEAFDDERVRAVWAIRGGYGCTRLLSRLDTSFVARDPKPFIGFSDTTAIHASLNGAGLPTLHGPMVAGLARASERASEMLWRALVDPSPPGPYEFEPGVIRDGECEGRLMGGNLSLVTRLIGTPFMPNLEGAILVLEDVGEAPYRVDRLLTHLEQAGWSAKLSGVLIGEFTACEAKGSDYTCMEVVAERVAEWSVPAVTGFPIGHVAHNLPLPLGVRASLDCNAGRLELSQGVVRAR